jgi:hypothetical protein
MSIPKTNAKIEPEKHMGTVEIFPALLGPHSWLPYTVENFLPVEGRYSPFGKGGRDCMPNVCAARNVIARSS